MSPILNITPTGNVAALVQQEIVQLPLYVLQHYETPLIGMAIIIAVFSAAFGLLRWFNVI